jgi:hypothetical protein
MFIYIKNNKEGAENMKKEKNLLYSVFIRI